MPLVTCDLPRCCAVGPAPQMTNAAGEAGAAFVLKAIPKSHLAKGNLIAGWWYTYSSEKYEFVNWDDEVPNICRKNVPNHQPDCILLHLYS